LQVFVLSKLSEDFHLMNCKFKTLNFWHISSFGFICYEIHNSLNMWMII